MLHREEPVKVPAASQTDNAIHLNEQSDLQVVLTCEDSDRFIRTQREIVGAMRADENFMSKAREASELFQQMVTDIVAWCVRHPNVASCTICPRTDDLLALVIATNEDEDGVLDESISRLDLEMFSRNKFRVTWLMLRASESSGAGAFLRTSEARCIYSATSPRTPKSV
jgi:hypothetical protein